MVTLPRYVQFTFVNDRSEGEKNFSEDDVGRNTIIEKVFS